MTASTANTRAVRVVDLVEDRDVGEAWLRETRRGDRFDDVDRVVIVDGVGDVAGDFPLYEHLCAPGFQLIVVAVGRPDEDGSGARLRLPGQLTRHEGAAVLWVGDEHGVWWGPEHAGRAGHRPTGGSGLAELKEVLGIEDVFADVVERARLIPHATASPALHVVSGSLRSDEVAATRFAAVARLTGPTRAAGRVALDLAGPEAGVSVVAPDSRVDRQRAVAVEAAEAADRQAALLGAWTTMLRTSGRRDVRAAVVEAGVELDAYVALVREAAEVVGASVRAGVPAGERPAGFGFAPPAEVEPAAVAAKVRAVVGEELGAGRSLVDVAAALRGEATRLTPGGTKRVEAELDACCPPGLSAALADPPEFPRWPIPPVTLPAAFAATAVAASLPGPFRVFGLVLGLLWVIAVAGAGAARPRRPSTPAAATALPVLAHGAAVAAGLLLARVAGVEAPVEVTAPLTLVGAGGLLFALVHAWRLGAHRWHAAARTADAVRAAHAVGEVLHRLAHHDWWLAERRRFASDALRAAAAALDEVSAEMRAIGREASPGDTGRGGDDPLLAAVVADDLVDLAVAALDPLWASLELGVVPAHGASEVDDRVRELFERYTDHLARRGVHEPPPFGRRTPRRDELVAETLRQTPEILAVVRRTGAEGMRQLCAGQDLARLDRSGADTQVIRFAPTLARPRLDAPVAAAYDDVRWTSGSLAAGVVRLVPLRAEVVHPFWPLDGERPW
ncbi:hypothetical protein ACFXGA_25160 [Actinosynnema sp. NPDC059335]|uniref:hypothetical protein n=1 Tax=Actinosynnema sp. NPDC059335 TaxID=3346804 RepID=UPI00366D3302